MTTHAVTLRPIGPDDMPLLFAIYAGTRQEELAPFRWSAAQQTAFLTQQFNAQHQYYQTHYTDTTYDLILLNGQPVGRLYVARWPDELRIVDIAILPPYRNTGVGSHLLHELLAEGTRVGKPVRIHVEKMNPALRLYERLGFSVADDRGVYWFMEWLPESGLKAVSIAGVDVSAHADM